MTGDAYTYSFGCPKCGGSWKFEEFASIAKEVFSSFDGVGVCPLCGVVFHWRKPGEMTTAKTAPWYQGKPHYKPTRCAFFKCNRTIEGRRKYCSKQCRQNAFYHRKKKIDAVGRRNHLH